MRWPQQEIRKTAVFLISSRLIDKHAACFKRSTFQRLFGFAATDQFRICLVCRRATRTAPFVCRRDWHQLWERTRFIKERRYPASSVLSKQLKRNPCVSSLRSAASGTARRVFATRGGTQLSLPRSARSMKPSAPFRLPRVSRRAAMPEAIRGTFLRFGIALDDEGVCNLL